MLPSLWPDRRRGGHQYAIDLPGYIALEAADDLWLALAFRRAPRDVLLGATISSHPSQTDHVQRTVSVPVAAAVEPMPDNLARGSFYGRHSAEAGEGGLAGQTPWIVPGYTQQRRGVMRTDGRQGDQSRRGSGYQPIQPLIEFGDLLREGLMTAGHRAQGDFRRGPYIVRLLDGAEASACADERFGRQFAQSVAQLLRSGHQQGLKLVGGLATGFHRRLARRSQGPDHPYLAVSALGFSGRLPGQHRP